MLNLISFFQTRDANVDSGVIQLPTNIVTDAGFMLINATKAKGLRTSIQFRVEDGFKTKANGKHLVYFYADTTKYPTQYSYLLSDGIGISKYKNEYQFRIYLNKRLALEKKYHFRRDENDKSGQ